MTEITDLSPTDASNTAVTGESLDGNVANMGRMDNTLQAVMGLLARSIRTNVFSLLDNSDNTKVAQFNLTGPTATTNEYDLPYYGGTLAVASEMRGHIYGLTLSNNTTDAINDIDIAAGTAVDDAGAVSMVLASTLVKRLDAAWAVGTNQGGLDTGSVGNSTYHVYLIRRPDTGVVDVCFSGGAGGPTLGVNIPAEYTQFRRIGSILRETGAIVLFSQNGNEFLRFVSSNDVAATNPGTAAVDRTLSVPNLITVEAIINVLVRAGSTAATGSTAYISSKSQSDEIPSTTAAPLGQVVATLQASTNISATQLRVRTDTSRVVRSRLSVSDAQIDLYIATIGWIDTRGQ